MTQPVYVYLLWAHDEYGPVDLVATLSRDKVLDLAKQHESGDEQEMTTLEGLLNENVSTTYSEMDAIGGGGYKLGEGWGGLHFQVVRLK